MKKFIILGYTNCFLAGITPIFFGGIIMALVFSFEIEDKKERLERLIILEVILFIVGCFAFLSFGLREWATATAGNSIMNKIRSRLYKNLLGI